MGCQNREQGFNEIELASYSFGPLLDVTDIEYNNQEIRIPYYVEGYGKGIVSEFSWFAFVDGLPQLTRLETLEGNILSEESYMHHFALEFEERKEFYVVFTPVSGLIGEQVGFITGALLKPNINPESVEDSNFSIFHPLSVTLPLEIKINQEIPMNFEVFRDIHFEEISPDILDQAQNFFLVEGCINEFIETWPFYGIFPAEKEFSLPHDGKVTADEGNVQVNLILFGGQEVTKRITFFVNDQPISVSGQDFIEIEMKNGMMAVTELNLELEQLQSFNTLYAIIMTTGSDFRTQDIFKTQTLLLVNE